MTAKPTQPVWASEALFDKALLYVEAMGRHTASDWQFGLWSALSLELIARAALAHISPTLLADSKNWRNIHHALGLAPTAKRFIPKSVTTVEVLSILRELLPEFRKELGDFCAQHVARRNAELHTGEDVFADLGMAAWLPKYYASCKVLLHSMGKTLGDLFDAPDEAEDMIASLESNAAEAVERDIKAHKKEWRSMPADQREACLAQATVWATRHAGHRAKCPACGSPSLIHGSPLGAVTTEVDQDMIVQRQTMLPSSFECIACNLRISGLTKLAACGLGDAFTAKSSYSAAEFFDIPTDEGHEEDFNEY